MKLKLTASKAVLEKLHKSISPVIELSEEASYALVEQGFDLEPGKINIVFDPLDFKEAYNLVEAFAVNEEQDTRRLLGFADNRYAFIEVKDILYIEAYRSEVTCITSKGKFFLKKPLYHYMTQLKGQGITQINKSQLVQLFNVREIIPWFNSRLVLKLDDQVQLEVSKIYSKELRKKLEL
jgi:two-component system response regulator LytT